VQPNSRTQSLASRLSPNSLARERSVLASWVRADTGGPVYSAIRNAFIDQFSLLYLVLTEGTGSLPEAMRPEYIQLDKDCTTLIGLLLSRSDAWAARDWRKPPILKFLFRRGKTGRPLTRLGIAAQVKELKLADPERWTWPALTAQFCDCGEKQHQISCQDNLRREVLHLEKLLERCGYAV
jgi:hypothetical protein